MYITHSIH